MNALNQVIINYRDAKAFGFGNFRVNEKLWKRIHLFLLNQRVEFEEVSGVKETDDLVENRGKIVSEDEIKEDRQKKKKKSTKNREEDVVEENLEDEQRKEEKKEKKKRKSDGENGLDRERYDFGDSML